MATKYHPTDCGHLQLVFGCASCIAKANGNPVKQALAEPHPDRALLQAQEDARNKKSRGRQQAKVRAEKLKQRVEDYEEIARGQRLETCGHEHLVFGCRHCEHSVKLFEANMAGPVSATKEERKDDRRKSLHRRGD